MTVKYVSGRVKELKVGLSNYSESKESLSVIGQVSVGGTTTGSIQIPDNVGIGTTALYKTLKIGTGLTAYENPAGNIQYNNKSSVYHTIENSGQLEAWNSKVSGVWVPQFRIHHHGAVEAYYDNGSIKFSTAGTGVTVTGTVYSDQLNISGVSTLTGNTFVGSGITMYASSGIVSATKFYGDGGNLTNTGAALGIATATQRLVLTGLTTGTMVSAATTSDVTFNATTDTFHIGTGVTVFGGTTGIVSAVSYNGDLVIGTPTGGFKTGAFTINSTDKTKDSINDLNNILGKLVPDPPDTINGVAFSLTGLTGTGRLCAGFTPTNNTGESAPVAGTQYSRNTDQTVTSNYITEYGPGDSGQVNGFVNGDFVGEIDMTSANNDGTYDNLQIANNEDASNSTRNTGIASEFYQIYDARLINAPCDNGYNMAYINQDSSSTQKAYWYEDPSTVGAPVISFASVVSPSSPTYSYSSGIPHYTESTNNNFTYVMTVTNASGDMYTTNTFVNSDGQTSAFQNPGNKSYTDFASGTNPPARNYGVGSGVTCLITNTPRNLHATVTSNIFTRYDVSTPYGSHNNQRVGFTTDFNIMGTTADYINNVDEDAIECTVGALTGGSATRVKAGATGDNPTPAYTAWTGGSAGSIDTYEAAVRGGDLRHDTTDYSAGGYLPVGPDYSSHGASQYFQFQFIQAAISEFRISYTGSLAGCWVCMPDNSTWTTSLSGTNGWADMFAAYKGSGVPTSAEPGCSSGGVMDTNGGTFTCVFGTESSSNDSNNRVLIRFKLTSGNSISDISLSDT